MKWAGCFYPAHLHVQILLQAMVNTLTPLAGIQCSGTIGIVSRAVQGIISKLVGPRFRRGPCASELGLAAV